MSFKSVFAAAAFAIAAQQAMAGPKIAFETNFFDFGALNGIESAAGSFKFKNTGDAVLQLEPPEPSCGCTDARVKPDTLKPGESGEVSYRIKLDHQMDTTRKNITVRSNDPDSPSVQLTMQLSYEPLFKFSTEALRVTLVAGKETGETNLTITRTDEKPMGIERITSTKDWITVAFDSTFVPTDRAAKVNVVVHRPPGLPAPFSGKIQFWDTNQLVAPVRTVMITGEIQGDIVASPPRIYWTIPYMGKTLADYNDSILTRKIHFTSALGQPFEIKSTVVSVTGMSAKSTPAGQGTSFELVLRFDQLPLVFTNGTVTIETTLPKMPKLIVPLTIAVFKP